ncbi:YegP family protein [Arthrobacter sp. G119Y2]|uniref:YegP family protein n=1 Tax=Arthrobacter sp. G119Y2 TaxID=3134965 RepID=UPI00311A7B04
MSGYFKLVDAHDGAFRIKLISGDGALMAVSAMFPTKQEAVAGIELLREIAGTGPVVDQSSDADVLGDASRNEGRARAS